MSIINRNSHHHPCFVDSDHNMKNYNNQPLMSRKIPTDLLKSVEQFGIKNAEFLPSGCGRLSNGNINGSLSQSPPTNSSSNSDCFDNGSEENSTFTSLKELSRHLPKGPAEVTNMKSIFHNEYKLNEFMKQTGYNVTQRNGQRIYGGPPPNWNGPAPDKGSEVFVGKVPRDMYEWELVPLFEKVGRIYEMRLMMDFSGSNRGYLFVRFFTRDEAKRAHKELNNLEVRPGKIIGVLPSVDNRKLWISGIPKNRTAEEIKGEMSKITEGVTNVFIYSHPVDKSKTRGYAFIEYLSHRAAALARRKLIPGHSYIFENEIEKVDWAEPENEVDEETMSKVKILFLRNLTPNVSEAELESIFENASNGPVERVKKAKAFAFIHFKTRDQAELAFVNINNCGLYLDGQEVEVQWAKPIDRQNHHQRKQLSKTVSTGNPVSLIPIANNPYGLPAAFGQFPSVNPGIVPPRPRGMAGIRGLEMTGTALPRNMVYQLNQFDQMALQENGRNFALKSRFDNGFDNGRPSTAWIPQVPTSPPPVNGNEYGNPNVGMIAPPLNEGLCLSSLVTRPNVACEHPSVVVYQLLGELPSFILAWLDILIYLTLVSACSRAMTATLDKTGDSWFHDFVLSNFGLTPFINTFPDFSAGGAVMITALFIAAGMEESKTMKRWLNILTGLALTFIIIVGIWKSKPETLKNQPFLLDGSNGVVLSACVLSLVFTGNVQMCQSAKSSSQPHRLVPLANGMSQLAMTLSLLMIAVILPMVAQLSPTGLVPEVPLLQAFENEVGRGWTRLIIAALTIICLCFTLLELSLPLHRRVQQLVSEGLLFQWLGLIFSKTDTPFFGSVIVGAFTATMATLANVSWLLLTGAAAKILFDLLICTCSLLVHYGVGLPQPPEESETSFKENSRRKNKRKRRRRHKNDLRTISSSIANLSRSNTASANATAASNILSPEQNPSHSSTLYQIDDLISPNTSNGKRYPTAVKKVVDAADKAKKSYIDRSWAKLRMIFSHHQILQSNDDRETSREYNKPPAVENFISTTGAEASTLTSDSDTSSLSGYGTETSDSSTDTDIDTIVNEYREEASLPTSIPECPDSEIKKPSRATTSVVSMATGVLLLSFTLQFIIMDNIRRSTMINAVILNLGISVAVFVLLILISKQPADKGRGRTDFTFTIPLAPWSQALAIFLNLSLLARILHSAWLELIVWLCLGLLLYFCYGMKNSIVSFPKSRATSFDGSIRRIDNSNTSDLANRRQRPNSLMLSPISVNNSDISGAANYTPTFDLTTLNKQRDKPSSIIKPKKSSRSQYKHQPLE